MPIPDTRAVVTVTQEDRDAADALDDALGFLTANERPIVEQSLAAHRIAAEARVSAREEVLRVQGQAEGFAAAVAQLRNMSATKPPASLSHAASILADSLDNSRKPGQSLHTDGDGS